MIAEPGTRITFVAIEGQVSVDITIRRMPVGWTCADCHGAADAVCRCEEWS